MKVILLKDVAKVGKHDTAVEVADGYALNFLIARGLAVQATPAALEKLNTKQQAAAQSAAVQTAVAAATAKKLAGMRVNVTAKVNDKGHLYQNLSADAIVAAIKRDLGVDVPASAIMLKTPIKTAGEWEVPLVLGVEKATVTVVVTG
jgi:large subunit ribosomal protein L9